MPITSISTGCASRIGARARDGATGADRQAAGEYASRLEENLHSLLERAMSGSYVAPPVHRMQIPKGDARKQSVVRG